MVGLEVVVAWVVPVVYSQHVGVVGSVVALVVGIGVVALVVVQSVVAYIVVVVVALVFGGRLFVEEVEVAMRVTYLVFRSRQ